MADFGDRIGFETSYLADREVVTQRVWGAISARTLAAAMQDLFDALQRHKASRALVDVRQIDVAFSPTEFIELIENLYDRYPALVRLAYVIHPEDRGPEGHLNRTLAWTRRIKVDFFNDPATALQFLSEDERA